MSRRERLSVYLSVIPVLAFAAGVSASTPPIIGGPARSTGSWNELNFPGGKVSWSTSGWSYGPFATSSVSVGRAVVEQYNSASFAEHAFAFGEGSTVAAAGTGYTHINAMNRSGIAVGFNATQSLYDRSAARWDMNTGQSTALDPLSPAPGLDSWALAVSENGIVAGMSYRPAAGNNTTNRPVRWSAGSTTPTELNLVGEPTTGIKWGEALGVNNSGTVVGYSATGVGTTLAPVRWEGQSQTPTQLGTLGFDTPDRLNGVAYAINNAGTAIGSVMRPYVDPSNVTKYGQLAVRWDANSTAAVALQTFAADANGRIEARPVAINASGDIAGVAYDAGQARPVVWHAGTTTMTELPRFSTLAGTASSLNDLGVVAGSVTVSTGVTHAAIWTNDHTVIDLNSVINPASGWTLSTAVDVDETGWVAGVGTSVTSTQPVSYLILVPQAGTYGKGDANFDTKTDFADLVILAQKYNLANPTQATDVADFDLNGTTDFQDLIVLAQNYNAGMASIDDLGGADFAADWALAQSFVPEPAISFVSSIALLLLGRRKMAR
jgi:hypothetical protein